MTIARRMSRLFQADLHGLLDQLEEPAALLKQAVREMEEDIARRDALLEATRGEAGRLKQYAGRLASELSEHEHQLDLCLQSGKDDLARVVVRKKLEGARLAAACETKSTETAARAESLAREVGASKEKLAEVKRRMELYVEAGLDATGGAPASAVVTDDDVELALLREIERRNR